MIRSFSGNQNTFFCKPEGKENYFLPVGDVLKKESLIGPITALNVTTLKNQNGDDSNVIFSARGPWVDLHLYEPNKNGSSSMALFSYLAFDDSNSGTVHKILQSFGEMCFLGKNNEERKACPWIFYGGKVASFSFVDMNIDCNGTPFQPIYFSRHGVKAKSHTFSDWVYDIRSIVFQGKESTSNILTAVGLAHNSVEIWNFSSMKDGNSSTLFASCLRKVISETRCITYSLSFYGWKPALQSHGNYLCKPEDLYLAVGVGTVMNSILIWNVLNEEESISLFSEVSDLVIDHGEVRRKEQYKPVIHSLFGHDGVIFSTKFGDEGKVIATTSDDRTIRLWKQNRSSNGRFINGVESVEDALSICSQHQAFSLIWTAYGHAARCWDSVFVSLTIAAQQFIPGIASVGEDSTIRLWTLDNGTEIANLRGHGCQNIWKIDTNRKDVLVTGGNDGVLKIWSIPFHMQNSALSMMNLAKRMLVQHLKVPFDDEYSDDNTSIHGNQAIEAQPKLRKSNLVSPITTQIMFGTNIYPQHEKKMLLATKGGMVKTLNLDTGLWYDHCPWGKPKSKDDLNISSFVDSASGLSMAIHPSSKTYVIGTSKGEILLRSLSNDTNEHLINFSVNGYPAIQEMTWVDSKNLLAYHIKGICVLWTFLEEPVDSKENIQYPSFRVLNMKQNGTNSGNIVSHYYDSSVSELYVGDSRGNIAYFDLSIEIIGCAEQYATSILRYAHKKEHVNQIISGGSRNSIISAGNDGFIHEIILRKDKEVKLVSSVRRPVPCLTAVTYLWKTTLSGIDTMIAGGYKGNNFILWDITSNYQLLCIDTGGRNRRIIFSPSFYDGILPLSFIMVIFIANKNSQNELLLYREVQFDQINQTYMFSRYNLGTPVHGETILDVSLSNSIYPGRMLLLSGSNDTTIKLYQVEGGSISLITVLPPHESCIRAVSISRHYNSPYALIAVSGGKLLTTFYLLDERNNCGNCITYLCSTKLQQNSSMDHRMNAIHAEPLLASDTNEKGHIILAGDSDGILHLTIVAEEIGQPRKISSKFIAQDINQRPILSIHMIRLTNNCILATTGNTGGGVFVWILSGKDISEILPKSPSLVYQAHQMGVNCVKTSVLNSNNEEKSHQVIIVTGGDDQSVSISFLDVDSLHGGTRLKKLVSINEACVSAVKGVHLKISNADLLITAKIFATGYDQRLSVWEVKYNNKDDDVLIKFITSKPIDVKDINAMDCCENTDQNGVTRDYVVVAGEGLELLSLDQNIFRAAEALNTADFLLITCGAGFSADSGLATYENMPEKYQNFCDVHRLIDATLEFQQFWSNFSELYSKTHQHSGYTILERWCGGKKLKKLLWKAGEVAPWYIYSSNVDSHFGEFPCFKDNICEIHGRANEFRCSCSIGYNEGGKRKGPSWNHWHETQENFQKKEKCFSHIVAVKERFQDSIQKCDFCGSPLRPNVLLFHDTDENVLNSISFSRKRYQEWESYVETQVIEQGKNLVIMELGAGIRVPAVRYESEEVYSDIQEKSKNKKCGRVTFIRINPKDAFSDIEDSISIFDTAVSALTKIDAVL